jgi:hypothetical protein
VAEHNDCYDPIADKTGWLQMNKSLTITKEIPQRLSCRARFAKMEVFGSPNGATMLVVFFVLLYLLIDSAAVDKYKSRQFQMFMSKCGDFEADCPWLQTGRPSSSGRIPSASVADSVHCGTVNTLVSRDTL